MAASSGFIEALDLLHWAMRVVMYWRIAMAIKMASKIGLCYRCCFVCCCPGSRWGNTEQVVAQWQHPVASGIALDMLHQAMHFVWHWCTTMTIKATGDEVHLLIAAYFFLATTRS
jgi:hypothetical protein